MQQSNLVIENYSPALREFIALAKEKLYREPQLADTWHPRDFSNGDHKLNPDFEDAIVSKAPRPAAVLATFRDGSMRQGHEALRGRCPT